MSSLSLQERAAADLFVTALDIPPEARADRKDLDAKIIEFTQQKIKPLQELEQGYRNLEDTLNSKIFRILTAAGAIAIILLPFLAGGTALLIANAAQGNLIMPLLIGVITTAAVAFLLLIPIAILNDHWLNSQSSTYLPLQNRLIQQEIRFATLQELSADVFQTRPLIERDFHISELETIDAELARERKAIKKRIRLFQAMQDPEFLSYLTRDNRTRSVAMTSEQPNRNEQQKRIAFMTALDTQGGDFLKAKKKAVRMAQEALEVIAGGHYSTTGGMPKQLSEGIAPILTSYLFEDPEPIKIINVG